MTFTRHPFVEALHDPVHAVMRRSAATIGTQT
jgi:hypothetical protein